VETIVASAATCAVSWVTLADPKLILIALAETSFEVVKTNVWVATFDVYRQILLILLATLAVFENILDVTKSHVADMTYLGKDVFWAANTGVSVMTLTDPLVNIYLTVTLVV